ncbi:bifunctional 4-hydroxy-2-oxoglutarate aldolase/2-dehydro-3-deoxy-phosphogluconate aldolase [Paenibacillus sp. MMS20-IR301]|uniref:bifunctional 4-hydroxy-2-oxoglutarate aldolase/2-dehydro-3-deoxy-phosphogluconate aldolase n=1 Tax=Paenibacillus sp. MMS20-IR301 TaxID=2895946 RepID=UPI0028EEE5C9|nr:bifunctional 4-hydroxy-2-oxoglutarate aldolase/2-dehydro-3-deoxy-phosphogluconate aldolase [Paenibacillus sp. MMS20-IR301]WNS43173.1 bifunctional 4-hydroxy-2-oxoglutarate aldolase/2-dehydro-3-deoxy-phosphogluconate aldolase [Paenibacillus sp. MMS20-IR301]
MNRDVNAGTGGGASAGAGAGRSAGASAGMSAEGGAGRSAGASAGMSAKAGEDSGAGPSASVIEKIRQHKVVAILRGLHADDALRVTEALLAGGITLVEIPFNQRGAAPGHDAPAVIRLLKERFGGSLCIGAGTALTAGQVDLAAAAGAEFILSPGTAAAVITRTKEHGLVSVPGAATASEMAEAYRCGADIVKLFPAGDLGIGYMKAVLAPLNHIPVMAVGGVDDSNLQEWLQAGACSVGIGARLVREVWVKERRYDELTALAAQYVSRAVQGGKTGS